MTTGPSDRVGTRSLRLSGAKHSGSKSSVGGFYGEMRGVKTQLRDESRNIRRLREIHQKFQVSVDLTLQPNTFIQRHLSYCCDLAFSDGT